MKVESEMDFRVGGSFAHKMNVEGAGEMTYRGTFDEIIEPERIVYHAQFGPMTAKITVEFLEQGNQTKLILTEDWFPAPELCQIVSQGLNDWLDELERLLASEMAGSV